MYIVAFSYCSHYRIRAGSNKTCIANIAFITVLEACAQSLDLCIFVICRVVSGKYRFVFSHRITFRTVKLDRTVFLARNGVPRSFYCGMLCGNRCLRYKHRLTYSAMLTRSFTGNAASSLYRLVNYFLMSESCNRLLLDGNSVTYAAMLSVRYSRFGAGSGFSFVLDLGVRRFRYIFAYALAASGAGLF